jgi:hypothetical protein
MWRVCRTKKKKQCIPHPNAANRLPHQSPQTKQHKHCPSTRDFNLITITTATTNNTFILHDKKITGKSL